MLPHTITAALAFALGAQSTPIFQNTGTLDDWDYVNEEHQGTVQEVTNVVYENSSALKMTQVYDPNYDDRYHSEVVKDDVYKLGDTGFYGFAFRLQEDWEFSPPQSYNIAQFIADFSDTGCDDYMPSTMVWLQGDQLNTRVKQGDICNQVTKSFDNVASVTAGEWHRIVIQSHWTADNTGFFKMWYDGEKVLEEMNLATTVDDDRAFQFRVGLYANGWYDDDGMQGSQGTRQVWLDEIAAGTTFADADPDQW